MIDTMVFYFDLTEESLAEGTYTSPVVFHNAGFIAQHGEGWAPVSHALTQLASGRVVLSVMLNRELTVDPDAITGTRS
ncbi:hypothetical protein ACRAWB_18285 [Leifsonia poae]|uniref:hypothetical protein n=1 Tax=Leifsonia poae TaxID=110933 RepID=UPI003D696911